jgi:hypothetical protein
MYALFAEDTIFQDSQWNEYFDSINGHRVVIHNPTNIPLTQPVVQQCSVLFTTLIMACGAQKLEWRFSYVVDPWSPLNSGHSNDTRFIKDTDIFSKQKLFAESNNSNTKPFLNLFDKGYQCVLVLTAMVQDQYFVCQPAYAESKKQFKANIELHSGAIAVVWSGDEHAANQCKMSWLLKQGTADQSWSLDCLCDVLEAWTFQVNFMFENFL